MMESRLRLLLSAPLRSLTLVFVACAYFCCSLALLRIPSLPGYPLRNIYTSLSVCVSLSFCEASMQAFRRCVNTYKKVRLHHDEHGRRMKDGKISPACTIGCEFGERKTGTKKQRWLILFWDCARFCLWVGCLC
jgi:hypothetical protein